MSEKRLPPSAKRLAKARREGKIVKSRLLTQAIVCSGAFVAVPVGVTWVHEWTLIQWHGSDISSPDRVFTVALQLAFQVVLVVVGAVAATGLVVTALQTKGLVAFSLLSFDANRISPQGWLGRAREGAMDAVMGVARCLILFWMMTPPLCELAAAIGPLLTAESGEAAVFLTGFFRGFVVRCAVVLLLIGGGGYLGARWRFVRGLRMSFEELRQEHREDEGDPHLRFARRHEHEAMIMSELTQRVRAAKVIVVRRAPSNGALTPT